MYKQKLKIKIIPLLFSTLNDHSLKPLFQVVHIELWRSNKLVFILAWKICSKLWMLEGPHGISGPEKGSAHKHSTEIEGSSVFWKDFRQRAGQSQGSESLGREPLLPTLSTWSVALPTFTDLLCLHQGKGIWHGAGNLVPFCSVRWHRRVGHLARL